MPDVKLPGATSPLDSRFVLFSVDGARLYVLADTAAAPATGEAVLVTFAP